MVSKSAKNNVPFMRMVNKRKIIIMGLLMSGSVFLVLEFASLSNWRIVAWSGNEVATGSGVSRLLTSRTSTRMKNIEARRSILGEWLRAPEGTPPPRKQTAPLPGHKFRILIWKYGLFLERRHVRHFYGNNSVPWPWYGCSVRNCLLLYRDEEVGRADAVVFHLHLMKGRQDMPARRGKSDQIWIFMTDESPINTFLYGYQNMSAYDDTFDWSMTYRGDSDVPIPYGRAVARAPSGPDNYESPERARGRSNSKLVAILGSNCWPGGNQRWEYVRRLKTRLERQLEILGNCLDGNRTACPGHFHDDCPLLAEYKFYLAFENSNCREYMTEKLFWNAYEKGSVPVIMGPPRIDCERLLPPRSFVHVDDYSTPEHLADYLRYLGANDGAYDEYHRWRSRYVVVNEHGYFGSISKHYCRVCEALNYNVRPVSKYRRLHRFWNSTTDCYPYN